MRKMLFLLFLAVVPHLGASGSYIVENWCGHTVMVGGPAGGGWQRYVPPGVWEVTLPDDAMVVASSNGMVAGIVVPPVALLGSGRYVISSVGAGPVVVSSGVADGVNWFEAAVGFGFVVWGFALVVRSVRRGIGGSGMEA